MAPLRVTQYRLAWHAGSHNGTITLVHGVGEGQETVLSGLAAAEFDALSNVLRNERPLSWDPATRTLFTGNEPVGEEELD